MSMTIVERARLYVSKMDAAVSGSGGHDATFKVACALVKGFALAEGDALALLQEYNQRCDPQWTERELLHKVRSAASASGEVGHLLNGSPRPAESERPREKGVKAKPAPAPQGAIAPFEMDRLVQSVRGVPEVGEDWFVERSAVDPRGVLPSEFLEIVYEKGERVLVFEDMRSQGDYLWWVGHGGYALSAKRDVRAVKSAIPRDGGKQGIWYLCQPVTGEWLPNGEKYSRRSAGNVTRWGYAVFECDPPEFEGFAWAYGVTLDEARAAIGKQVREAWSVDYTSAAFQGWKRDKKRYEWQDRISGLWLRFLAQIHSEIVAIYSSGGRSWHALVRLRNEGVTGQADVSAWMAKAKTILPRFGADGRALTPVRLTRLPGCTRNGQLQRLIYLNPDPNGPILEQLKRRTL